jgi:hypothetical protein
MDIKDMANAEFLLTHKDFYKTKESIGEILDDNVNETTLTLLSSLSFKHHQAKAFKQWSISKLAKSNAEKKLLENYTPYGRLQIWTCWKHYLSNFNTASPARSAQYNLATLHRTFCKINDSDGEHQHPQQFFLTTTTALSRDNCEFQFIRAKRIFLENAILAPYIADFEDHYKIKLIDYLNIIFLIVNNFHLKDDVDYLALAPVDLKHWIFDIDDVCATIAINRQTLVDVLDQISSSLAEGQAFAKNTINEQTNFTLFRNRPFIKLSPTQYLPIEGKLVEDLLFNNLYYKIKDLYPGKSKFMDDFGIAFEQYAVSLSNIAFSEKKEQYKIIPEFPFGKPRMMSPDLMIDCPEENAVTVIEIKSARVLDRVFSTERDDVAVDNSFQKTKARPLLQAFSRIQDIVQRKAHPGLTETKLYQFLAVTMNDFPLILENIVFTGPLEEDISSSLFSMNIEAYEVLLKIISCDYDFTLNCILAGYNQHKKRMSIKTYLSKIFTHNKLKSSTFDQLVLSSRAEYIAYMHAFRAEV